jgi:hypothetical protein
MSLGGCGGRAAAGNDVFHLPNAAVAAAAADGLTDVTYILDGLSATIGLPPSDSFNKGRRVTVNVSSAGGTGVVNAALGDSIEQIPGSLFAGSATVFPGALGGINLIAQTWQADGANKWFLVGNNVALSVA